MTAPGLHPSAADIGIDPNFPVVEIPTPSIDEEARTAMAIVASLLDAGVHRRDIAIVAREIASRLTEKGWLDRLFPGTYLIIPLTAGEDAVYTAHEYLIAAHVAEPMYIGYYSALSHHGLTEQVPRTVYVVTPTRAQSREIHGVPYRVTTVTEQKFFGCEPTSVEGTTVQVSDLEKTLVDCADHPEFCGGLRELATAMRTADDRGCDWDTVGEYLERLHNGAATKRIVYLADQLDIDIPAREELVTSFTSGYSLLDPTQPETGSTDSTYRLRINITPAQLEATES
jgi:predicted transcriptional regulator of viral defense system